MKVGEIWAVRLSPRNISFVVELEEILLMHMVAQQNEHLVAIWIDFLVTAYKWHFLFSNS